MVTKSCSRKDCKEANPQPIKNFGVLSRVKSGHRSECKTCRKTEAAKAYAANPTKVLERNARWVAKHPERAAQAKTTAELNAKPYKRFKMGSCALCPFIPVDACQMDVDHIDGDHSNNDPGNLQTLCANCHRLKTKRARDGAYSGKHMEAYVKLRLVK